MPTPPPPALAGRRVGVTAARRREELGTALERHGAQVEYGPAVRIVALADDDRLLSATRHCLAEPPDIVVGTTGVGFRGWLEVAEQWGLGGQLVDTLRRATILARGPKVRGAVRAAGLREAWSPPSESSGEVLAHLLAEHELAGARIVVQLHGDPLHELVDMLRAHGAEVVEVPVYRWEPPADERPLRRVLELTGAGALDALTFTSAPAATNFLRTAAGLGVDVAAAARAGMLCAAVGPTTAGPLQAAGIDVAVPDRHRLGALVRTVVSQLQRLPDQASSGPVAGPERTGR